MTPAEPKFLIVKHAPRCRRLAEPYPNPLPCSCWPEIFVADFIAETIVQAKPGLYVDSSKKRRLADMEIVQIG